MEKEGKSLFITSLIISACLGAPFIFLVSLIFRQFLTVFLGYLCAWGVLSMKTLFFSTMMVGKILHRKSEGWTRFSMLYYLATFVALGGLVVAGAFIGKAFIAGICAGVIANALGTSAWGMIKAFKARTC
jgi:hypothetical protein